MGAEPWAYFVPYRPNVAEALDVLKEEEFAAGRYRNPLGPDEAPATIDEAMLNCDADGTGSILDMTGVADEPLDPDAEAPNFCMVSPLSREQLVGLFGTERPTHEMVASTYGYYELIDRGVGLYIIVYDGDAPSEIFFAGYSFD